MQKYVIEFKHLHTCTVKGLKNETTPFFPSLDLEKNGDESMVIVEVVRLRPHVIILLLNFA